jgi:aryl-alcohol dehydrogenase-like predicted oxidoreductase
VGVIPWSPLNGGLLGGVIRKTEKGQRRLTGRAAEGLKKHRKAIKAWEELCDELGEQPADVALAWLLHQDGVTAPIVGPRTHEQLDGSLRALRVRLKKDVLERLDEIFPGPGGPAPEAYCVSPSGSPPVTACPPSRSASPRLRRTSRSRGADSVCATASGG